MINCYYFNFLASHDGVGVRPLEGLVPDEDFKALVDSIPEQGGLVSKKANADGSESPYELNITYFSALADSELVKEKYQIQRFLCAHTIMLTLQGVPGIYIHSMLATSNDHEGVKTKKYNRAINRRQWEYDELNSLLDDENTEHAQVFEALKERLKIRSQQPAFHPEAPQKIYSVDPAFFTVIRRSHDNTQTILSVSNVTNEPQTLEKEKYALPLNRYDSYENLLGEDITASKEPIILQPFESIWLVIK